MSEKYILLSMEDEKLKKVSEILSNKTCKKILDFMADEKSVSETDISKKLEIPLNTVEYNLKKLVGVQLVEKTSEFFWSKKGKKITIYQISNKSIIISPRASNLEKLKSFLPILLISGAFAFLIKVFSKGINKISSAKETSDVLLYSRAENLVQNTNNLNSSLFTNPVWIWFLFGAIFALILFGIFNWKRLKIERRLE